MKIKNRFKKTIFNTVKQIILGLVIFAMIFPYNTLVVFADPVPVEEVGWNREWNFRTSEYTNSLVELLGEVVGPVYQLATPGSNLTYDIYRYLMKHTEDELGIDKDFFRRMKRKVAAPTVDIVFAPTNPKIGEKVTAFAVPHGFRNSKDKLYFTWYIVHNDEKDVTAGRDEAMRMVAAGGYDRALFGEPKGDDGNRDAYNVSAGGDDGVGKKSVEKECDDSCDWVENMTMFGGEVTEGYFDDKGLLLFGTGEEYEEAKENRSESSAALGRGVVNSTFISRCYRHNFGRQSQDGDDYSGRDLVISCKHAFDRSLGTQDNSFDAGEEEKWGTNPENADTDGDGVVDEADLVGLGQDEFTWIYRKGDKVSVVVEGMSNIPINEGSTDRLRYKNKNWEGEDKNLDLSPIASPEDWYKKKREECQKLRETASNNEYSDCMKQLWEHKRKDKNDEDAFGDMTGYYKIMWAAPGICSEEAKGLYENDWCDEDGDLGFQYLKLYDPVEQGKKLLEVSVNISPKNPQFKEPEEGDLSDEHSDSTDRIVARASVVSEDNINPDYLYYKWSVWKCDPEDFDKCEDVTDELTGNPKFRSRLTGLGQREIWFYPDDFLIDGDRTLLKIGVIVKKHQNSVMSSPGINGEYTKQIFSDEKKEIEEEDKYTQKYAYTASKLVEVTRHTMNIKLYQADPTGSGGWTKGKEICGENSEKDVYRKVCPVYQYQVLMAEVENAGPSIAWYLNGQRLGPTLNAENNATNPNDPTVFFPITGVDGDLKTIKVISEKENQEGDWEDGNISEARVLSVHRPMAKIVNKNLAEKSIEKAYAGRYDAEKGYYRKYKNNELWWIKASKENQFAPGESIVDIPITIIPRYLQDEVDGKKFLVQGYVDGVNIGNLTPGNNSIFENVHFQNTASNQISNFKIRIIRRFNKDYLSALYKSFGISPPDELVHDLSAVIKAISPDDYYKVTGKRIAINTKQKIDKFFASTISNAPEYFVFILRLAISFVLVIMISFGLIYGTRKIN